MDIRVSPKHGVNPMLVKCFWCGRDTGDIALLGRLPDDKEAPRQGVLNYEPCDACKALMAQGVTLMEHDGKTPTGRWVVVKDDFITRVVTTGLAEEIIQKRKAYIEPALFTQLVSKEE